SVVGDLLAAAGQPVEQRRLAAVRDTGQRKRKSIERSREAHSPLPSSTATVIAAASRRRSAKTDAPTRTAIGSPPGQISSTTSTRSPGQNPSSSNRRLTVERAESPRL